MQVVASGHPHKPQAVQRDGVWSVNPGNAGPRRFKLPVALGELRVEAGRAQPRIVEPAVQNAR